MTSERIEQDGISWIEVKQAAKLSRTKALIIEEQISARRIESIQQGGRTYISAASVNRLKREAATMAKVKRLNKAPNLPPARSFGVLVKNTQDVLPMSSGRAGRGWRGQRGG